VAALALLEGNVLKARLLAGSAVRALKLSSSDLRFSLAFAPPAAMRRLRHEAARGAKSARGPSGSAIPQTPLSALDTHPARGY